LCSARKRLAVSALLASVMCGIGIAASAPASAAAPKAADCEGASGLLCDMAGAVVSGSGIGLAAKGLDTASSGLGALAENAFGQMAAKFGEAGIAFLESLSRVFVESSTVDLGAAGIDPLLAITMPIAMLVAVLLVVTAAAKTAVSASGSVAGAALVGLVKTMLVTALLVAVTQMALKAADALSVWIIERSLGGNAALEQRLGALITLDALNGSPALVLLFGLLAIVLALVLWVELLFRRVAIVVLVAVAPVAATGQILEGTTEWWHKTRNALLQLILLKPVMALCFAIGFATFGSARDLTGVIAGFVTLGLAAFAWPLLARFMTFTSVGGGHAAVAGMVTTTAGFLAGRRFTGGSPVSGPSAHAGTAYTTALEQQNDTVHAAGALSRNGAAGRGNTGAGASVGGMAATGGIAAAAGAAVGAAATAGSAVLDHVESQASSAASDAGLGHASAPRGHYGATHGRLGRARRVAPHVHTGVPTAAHNGHPDSDHAAHVGSDDSHPGEYRKSVDAYAPPDVTTQEQDGGPP
jgi:hypothetical protein